MKPVLWITIPAAAAAALFFLVPTAEDAPLDPFTDHYELAQDVRKHLWQVEQAAFVLVNQTGPALADALLQRDMEPWRESFTPDFSGAVFAGPPATEGAGSVRLESWEETESPTRDVDGAALAAWLLALRDRFTKPAIEVHAELLRPRDRATADGPFDATWTIRLRGDLAAGGKGTVDVTCALVYERIPDGEMNAWISRCRTTRRSDHSAPGFLMEEVTETFGVDSLPLFDRWLTPGAQGSVASYLLDFDRDGRLDLLLCDRRLFLYRGLGNGRVEDVTAAAGLFFQLDWHFFGGTVADFDNDGDEDLLLDAAKGKSGLNLAFENRGDGTFRRVEPFTQTGGAVSQGAVADFDGDGLVDLYVPRAGTPVAEGERRARWIGDRTAPEGVLLRNRGGWRFEDVTTSAGVLSDHTDTFGAAWMDFEPDGDVDLFLANHWGPNVLFLNRGDGTFVRHGVEEGFGGFSMGLSVGDLDGDGDPDAYLANMSSAAGKRIIDNLREDDYPKGVFPLIEGFIRGNVALENLGAGRGFREAAVQTAGWAYGPAMVDLDGDGLLDIYCPAGYQSVERGKPDG